MLQKAVLSALVVCYGLLAKWLRVIGLGLGLGPGNALAVLLFFWFIQGRSKLFQGGVGACPPRNFATLDDRKSLLRPFLGPN